MANLDQYRRKPKTNLEQYRRNQSKPEPEEDSENLLQKIVRYGIKDPVIGVLNMGREFANLPNKLTGGWIPEGSRSDLDFGETLGVKKPDSGDNIIQTLAQIAPAFALPGANIGKAGKLLSRIPGVGKYASRAVSDAIPQALYGAAQAPHDSLKAGAESGAAMAPFSVLAQMMQGTSQTMRALAKTGMGVGGAYLGHQGAKAVGFGDTGADIAAILGGAIGGRGFGTKKDMMKKLTEGVHADVANPRIAAANKLRLDYLTPAEAGISPWAAKQQGKLGRTEEGGKMLYERGMQRQKSEKAAIEKTLEQIYSPSKMDSQVDEAYKSINEVNLPQEFPLQYKENEIIKEAKKLVESTPAYKESLKQLMPKNVKLELGQTDPQATSLVYWDHVKRAMDDMVAKAERAGNNNEARIISNTRRDMRNQMDESFPEYKEARSLYERKMVRESLEKAFDRKAMNGTNFYKALESDKKFDEISKHLKNAPEALGNLKAMREVFKDLMGPPTIKTAKGTEERGMNQARNPGNYMEHLMEHAFTKGIKDEDAIKFITSKDWGKQLKEINKISDKHLKSVAFGLLLSKGLSQATGRQDRKPMELELIGGHG